MREFRSQPMTRGPWANKAGRGFTQKRPMSVSAAGDGRPLPSGGDWSFHGPDRWAAIRQIEHSLVHEPESLIQGGASLAAGL